MQPTVKQERYSSIPLDIAKQENLYLRDALSRQDFLITHTLRQQVTTKRCFSRFQNSKGGSFLKAIGTSKKVQRLLSLTVGFMLLSLFISLATGSSFVHVTMVTAVILVFFGLQLRLTSNLSYIENFMSAKSSPQTWLI